MEEPGLIEPEADLPSREGHAHRPVEERKRRVRIGRSPVEVVDRPIEGRQRVPAEFGIAGRSMELAEEKGDASGSLIKVESPGPSPWE